MRGMTSAHTRIMGGRTASTSQNPKNFEATVLGQSKPDQALGHNTQMPTLSDQLFVVFRGAYEQFYDVASQEQRLQTDRPSYRIGEMEHEFKC